VTKNTKKDKNKQCEKKDMDLVDS